MASLRGMFAVVLCLSLFVGTNSAKFDFVGTQLPPLTQISRRHGMFAPDNTPSTGPPGNGQAYMDLDVTFRREESSDDCLAGPCVVQAIIFHNEELENVHRAADSGQFCCTVKNEGQYGCKYPGEFVPTYQPLFKMDVELPKNGTAVSLQTRFPVQKTGLHYLMYSSCQLEAGVVFIEGHNTWMNPYGYVSGELYYNMPFFLAMTFVHVLALVFWAVLLYKYREEVLPVQGHIAGVIVLSLLEVMLWFFEYRSFNNYGTRPFALMVAAIIVGTVKKTLSRLLVLVVCMGYGIVKPNLGNRACQVITFGVVYCVFSAILDVIKALSHDNDVSGGFFILVIIPVAVLDSVFYLWTFMSLYDVVAQLEERRQTQKLQLYRSFIWVLGTCLVLSCVWVLYQMYFLWANLFPSAWQYAWMFDAYWYALSLAIMFAIMYLWAPNENSKRYAYYEENVNLEGDDDDGIELEQHDNSLQPAFSIDEEGADDIGNDDPEPMHDLEDTKMADI